MLLVRLNLSFDRGVKRNDAKDIGLDTEPTQTTDGGLVRGIGTHYISEAAREEAVALEAEDRRIRKEFAQAYLSAPIPGLYVVPDVESGPRLLASLNVDPRMTARCAVYNLEQGAQLPPAELQEWTARLKRQMEKAPLGRAVNANAEGLAVLERLAACPVLSKATQAALTDLIQLAKLDKLERVEFRRRLSTLAIDVEMGPVVAPRRVAVPKAQEPAAAV